MLIQQCIARVRGIARRLPLRKMNVAFVTSFLSLIVIHSASAAAPSQDPLFLSNPVVPLMMLNMSKDHQLYYKVYDDYSDLDGGGVELTYKHSYDYYGYFDSEKCYAYQNNQFEPTNLVDGDGYCTGKWSGNFLNWATMTRIDSIRKILYGGLRSTDTATETVLERAFLPHDAHSFAKYYDGTDLNRLTPFTAADVKTSFTKKVNGVNVTVDSPGFTICNTTSGTGLSQSVTTPPKLRLAKGNHMFWASNERWQCRWRSEISQTDRGVNGNNPAITGKDAFSDSPSDANKLSLTVGSAQVSELNARVKVCVADLEESNCYKYPTSTHMKPQGLLQEFGEIRNESNVAKINFGLMTGSYSKNKSGGVLRKAIGNMATEVNADTDGTFKKTTVNGVTTQADGVLKTLNLLRPYGYSYSGNGEDGAYNTGDNCSWGKNSFLDNSCTNWGNPQAEIYLESLRYLLGKSVNSNFSVAGADKIPGLTSAAWGTAPVTEGNYCAPLNILQFNASTTSYDGDNLGTSTDVMGTATTPEAWTNIIADASHEAISGKYFVGATGAANEANAGLCTGKTIGSLSNVRGTCPDAPRLEGSYNIAGLAYYARTNDLIPNNVVKGIQTVRTFGVALAPALPKVEVSSPDKTKKVSILPACKNVSISGNCALVDFKILSQTSTATTESGLLYVNWEDSEQGGDYDQDMWGVIKYAVTNTGVTVTTDVVAESTPDKMGFGYVIGGTNGDGPHFQSGIENFNEGDCITTNCNVGDSEKSKAFLWGSSGAKFLESPLYYAAKWGGFSEGLVETEIGKTAYDPDKRLDHYKDAKVLAKIKGLTVDKLESYYFATDPRKLEASLRSAFRDVAKAVGSASAVATNSTRLSEGSYVFQAQFNSEDWSGELNVFEFDANGGLPTKPTFSTANNSSMPINGTGRNVYTFNGSSLVDFSWGNLTAGPTGQQNALKLSGETDYTNAQKRVDWLLGNATYETDSDGLRKRGSGTERVILGDIVNSSPAYVGAWDFRYNRLPEGGSSYRDYVAEKKKKVPRIFVGANDGALHAFQAPIEGAKTFKELYAYIPGLAYPKLASITEVNYGTKENEHQFIVDGPITVGDVYMSDTDSWRTIIVGSMGAGGRGVYALDITGDKPKVLWELSEKDYPQMGYVMGKPLIVPMKNNRWAAVFGNGTGSGETSSLFVVDIEAPRNPSYTRVLDVDEGTGLSAPALLSNAIGQIEVAYAGDLSGNLWRFDLSGDSASGWETDYLLFVAKDDAGYVQPITAAPTLGLNALKDNKVMVYFGTGKYFDSGDNAASVTPIHSYYAIADMGRTVARSDLFVKTLTTSYTSKTRSVNQDVAVPVQSPDWANNNGWRLNFDTDGERVTTKAILLQDWLIFPTLIPSALSCDYGGRSWLMAVRAVGDKASAKSPLTNVLNTFLVLGDVGFGQLGTAGKGAIVGSGTDATLLNIEAEYDASTEGRQSWRQLQ